MKVISKYIYEVVFLSNFLNCKCIFIEYNLIKYPSQRENVIYVYIFHFINIYITVPTIMFYCYTYIMRLVSTTVICKQQSLFYLFSSLYYITPQYISISVSFIPDLGRGLPLKLGFLPSQVLLKRNTLLSSSLSFNHAN